MKYQADLWDLERESKMEEKQATVIRLHEMGIDDNKIAKAVETGIDTVRQWIDAGMAVAK